MIERDWTPKPARDQAVIDRYRETGNQAAVAAEFCLHQTFVSKILKKKAPEVLAMWKERRRFDREQRRVERLEAANYDKLASAKTCVVCGGKNMRGKFRTCSRLCSQLWNSKFRFTLDPEMRRRHLESYARTILKYPDKYAPPHLRWARKLLGVKDA